MSFNIFNILFCAILWSCAYAQLVSLPICPENSAVDSCANPCQPSCDDLKAKPCPTFTCSTGCICQVGYVWDRSTFGSSQKCILPTQCPRQKVCTGANEEYTACGTACPKTCDNLNPQICTMNCVEGCFCTNGTVRDSVTKKCIPPNQCPVNTICKTNEVYLQSGTDCTCDQCTAKSSPGCFCKDGYVRNNRDQCVTQISCKSCQGDPNAEISKCGQCPKNCLNWFWPISLCDKSCVSGCQCKNTLVRGWDGTCTSPLTCYFVNPFLLLFPNLNSNGNVATSGSIANSSSVSGSTGVNLFGRTHESRSEHETQVLKKSHESPKSHVEHKSLEEHKSRQDHKLHEDNKSHVDHKSQQKNDKDAKKNNRHHDILKNKKHHRRHSHTHRKHNE